MPVIAFGTGSKWKGKARLCLRGAPLAFTERATTALQDVTDYVIQAVETGFSHIDTAQWYQTEDGVGDAIRESALDRRELYLTTKWSGLTTIPEAIDNSLKELGVKYVDLYLIHNPRQVEDLEQAWREFEKIKETGLSKSIGVSNFNVQQLQQIVKIAKFKPAVNQILFHPYNYAENKELLEYSAKHGIITEAYSSLTPITRYPGGPVDAPLKAAADRLNATPVQVLLSWVRSKGVAIVTTSSTKGHLEEYLEVADLPSLTEEEIAAIDEAGAKGPSGSVLKRLHRNKYILAVALLLAVLVVMLMEYAAPKL
uniref:Mannitol dehydrogenase n=1 Tax=Ganoderma boninense TaxID=34458 RepID=A0A5K1K995_9APHY|nr:Mannitol dehydrogenase [Ganoderma boninense]